MKIAIGFFGITRSLKYTIQSIELNVFNVLKDNNIEYDIFLHTYNLSSYKNVRTREKPLDSKDIDNEEYKLLNPNYFKIDDQDEIKEKINIMSYRTNPDPWRTGYNSVDNFILGTYSKHMLTKMIEERENEKENKYNYIIFMRPDCRYIEKLNIEYLKSVDDTLIVIPNFHLFGKYKINDRFAITNRKTYKIYGNMFEHLLNISKKHMLHSETILGFILEIYRIYVKRVKFRFLRIRHDGSIAHDEYWYK